MTFITIGVITYVFIVVVTLGLAISDYDTFNNCDPLTTAQWYAGVAAIIFAPFLWGYVIVVEVSKSIVRKMP